MSYGLEELAGDLKGSGFYLSPPEFRHYSSLPSIDLENLNQDKEESTEMNIRK